MLKNNWNIILKDEFSKDYFKKLSSFINDEYNNKIIFPNYDNIFEAFNLTDYNDVLVVILGQDPYHGINEAHGLSFSLRQGVKITPSLRNIFKELKEDLGIERTNTDLTDWAKQGVLLLNTVLTVEKDNPLSHKDKGWEIFTDTVIRKLNEKNSPVIFVLWGNYAKSKKYLITNNIHKIVESAHPSPLSASRGFFGSKPFSKVNNYLKEYNKIINW